jgi:hypothetical protein
MEKCEFCDDLTSLYEHDKPICLRCLKVRDQRKQTDSKKVDHPDSGKAQL